MTPPAVDPPDELPTELVRTVVEEGSGPAAGPGDTVIVHYVGVLSEDGTMFDNSYAPRQGQQVPMPLSVVLASPGEPASVIDGWNEGLQGARPGDQIRLDIPADLAYGDQEREGIPPDSALTFLIDVVNVVTIDYPSEVPTELVKTDLVEGDPDGKAAQRYDTIEFNWAIGVPDVVGDTEGPTGSLPSGSVPVDSVEPTDSVVPVTTVEAPATTADEPVTSEGPVSSEPGDDAPLQLTGEGSIVFADNFTGDQANGVAPTPTSLLLSPGTTGIEGLELALEGARPGDIFQVDVPADLAFGESGVQGIVPPDTPVSMYIEILNVTGPPLIEVPTELPTELQVTTLTEGDGPAAAEGDTVVVKYVGVVTESNLRIDSTWDGPPEYLVLGDGAYVEGFEQGLVGAKAGAELQLDIPADLAYGADGVPDINLPADTPLTFLVDVLAVIPATAAAEAPTDVELPLSTLPMKPPVVSDPDGNPIDADYEQVSTDLVAGTGTEAESGATAIVNVYAACASNGAVLQNTWDDEQRQFIDLTLGGNVQDGLVNGIIGMQVGGRRMIQVPADLAFGELGDVDVGVGPNHDLIFIVELYGVV